MEKGFRIFQCPGCPAKLRIQVSEKDYGTTKKIRCPKCSTQGRVKIPHPAPEAPPKWDFPEDPFGNLFGDIFKGSKK